MEEHAESLRRRIALYRRYLAEGLDADLARIYLGELADADAELSEIARYCGAYPCDGEAPRA